MTDEQLIQSISNTYKLTNPYLIQMHKEADAMQDYMEMPANIIDPAALNDRLNVITTYIPRLERILADAKQMREYAIRCYQTENEEKLAKLTATVSNRLIKNFLYEFNVSVDRFEAMYSAMCNVERSLITQVSYIKSQMNLH